MSIDKSIEEFLSKFSIIGENKNELYSLIIPIILSRKFFKNKAEKKEFIESILKFNIADYAYNSKTILIGKIIDSLNSMEIQDAVVINNRLNNFINEVMNVNTIVKNDETKLKIKEKKLSFFSNWSTYINNISNVDTSIIAIIEKILSNEKEIIKKSKTLQDYINKGDDEYRKVLIELDEFLATFSDNEIMILQSLMYIGRDIYTGFQLPDHNGVSTLMEQYFDILNFRINRKINKDIEISQMTGKSRNLVIYFKEGFNYIRELNEI